MAVPDIIADPAQIEITEVLDDIEGKIHWEYVKATEEMRGKFEAYMKRFIKDDEAQRELLGAGEITATEYAEWRERKMLIGSRWAQMLEVLAVDAVHTDMIAMSIVKDHLPEAYAIGHNYGTYLVESGIGIDTSYTLYDRFTIERLWRENPKLLPDPLPDSPTALMLKEHKDLVWNKNHLQSALTQSILQGEPLNKVADRVKSVTDMDERAARRNAATMLTSAQNGGRIDSFKRAESMGIRQKKVWIATLDGHTRTSHRYLDGQEADIDEPFKSEYGDIMFPGDPSADPADVYNCRCTLITQIKGYERDVSGTNLRHDSNLKDMSYGEWKAAKGNEPLFKAARNEREDARQMREYQSLLGRKKVPDNLGKFQDLKYWHTDEWEDLKKQAREARKEARKK